MTTPTRGPSVDSSTVTGPNLVPHQHDALSVNGRTEPLYDSADVYANGVPIALYNAAVAKASASVNAVVAVVPPVSPTIANGARLEQYIANPGNFSIDSNDQVKQNFPGNVEQDASGQALISTASAGDLVSFLTEVLSEANRGIWQETGMGGRASNPRIVDIWKELGYPRNSYWLTDQTPWCMGFVNWVLKRTGYRYVQTAAARDIQARATAYGAASIPLNQGQPGDIALWSYGHVNFVYTANAGRYTFIGGNQSSKAQNNNNPSSGSITKSWPTGYAVPGDRSLVGLWRPVQTAPPPAPEE
jgi:uncharacterized protein (TIGR02594 family)